MLLTAEKPIRMQLFAHTICLVTFDLVFSNVDLCSQRNWVITWQFLARHGLGFVLVCNNVSYFCAVPFTQYDRAECTHSNGLTLWSVCVGASGGLRGSRLGKVDTGVWGSVPGSTDECGPVTSALCLSFLFSSALFILTLNSSGQALFLCVCTAPGTKEL